MSGTRCAKERTGMMLLREYNRGGSGGSAGWKITGRT